MWKWGPGCDKHSLLLGPGVCVTKRTGPTNCVSHRFESYMLRTVALQKGRPKQDVYLHESWLYHPEERLQYEFNNLMGVSND